MPARNIQITAVIVIIAVVAVVIAATQLSGDSGGDPTSVPQASPTATAMSSPSPEGSATATAGTLTPTPTSSPTATSTPSPTPTPEPPDATIFAIIELSDELDAPSSEFTVLSYERATWPAADYGCPAPGNVYAQSEVEGWSFEIGHEEQVFEFHSDASGDTLVNCTSNRSLMEDAVNIVELAGLSSTTQVEVRRINSEGGYDTKGGTNEPEDIQEIIDVLNVPVVLSPVEPCVATAEIVFTTAGGEQVFHAFCSGQSQLVFGDQGFWDGMGATVPIEFNRIIGPYLAQDDFPGFPSPTAQ